jgi:hypothetical protein
MTGRSTPEERGLASASISIHYMWQLAQSGDSHLKAKEMRLSYLRWRITFTVANHNVGLCAPLIDSTDVALGSNCQNIDRLRSCEH